MIVINNECNFNKVFEINRACFLLSQMIGVVMCPLGFCTTVRF
uniref:Uncharacterized protein n=1 Tax=CrAss-like virus sp. ctWDt29 TaxID=2825836 RepID=A0A8S5NVL1_9CAUD|nr:MAG TPA: hypothetical protein [CrAss-like virus sp. ctWDt29]